VGRSRGNGNGQTLREQALEQVRASLLSGELQPDVTYSVPNLAADFGVSATPMREAILDLVKEGLVVTVPNRGFRLVSFTPEKVAQVAAVRKLVEVPATVAVSAVLSDEQVADLLKLATKTRDYALTGDLQSYLRADREFHEQIMGFTGNPVLVELTESLRAKARLHALPTVVATGKLAESAQEHIDLIEAMREGDVDAIRLISEHHIDYAVRSQPASSALLDI
jgi:DNA-binding GntR family transcriptional regulator